MNINPTVLAQKLQRIHKGTSGQEDRLPTGIATLDQLTGGGVPRGEITGIVGVPSSGRTSLLLSILAQATARQEIVAYIDALDCLDPSLAATAGVDLKRLLWIRCGASSKQRFAVALKAADILAEASGFGALALDLGQGEKNHKSVIKIPFNCWFRLRRAIEGTQTALLVLENEPTAGSASALVLSLQKKASRWIPSARLFRRIEIEAQLLRGKRHSHVTFHCDLQA